MSYLQCKNERVSGVISYMMNGEVEYNALAPLLGKRGKSRWLGHRCQYVLMVPSH